MFEIREDQRKFFFWDEDQQMDQCRYRQENGSAIKCDRGYVYDR